MSETIAGAVAQIKNTLPLASLDEARTKQGVVLRLLSLAGWNAFDLSEVTPEYTVGARRVDYALRIDAASKVFIEVKKPSEDLQNHQQQLLDYCFKEGVGLAALTNGRTWWLYLPLREGSWEQRRFLTIDLESQDPEVVQERFLQFLSRNEVKTAKAVHAAEEIMKSQIKLGTIRMTLVRAWNDIVQTPDGLLVDLIAEATERMCGFKPDTEIVAGFLEQHLPSLLVSTPTVASRPAAPVQPATASERPTKDIPKRGLTGTKPSAFVFDHNAHEVGAWIEVLYGVCEILHTRHRKEFDNVLKLRGRKRPYFSRSGDELRKPGLLQFASLYVETNLSANAIVSLCDDVVKLFGYESDVLTINTL